MALWGHSTMPLLSPWHSQLLWRPKPPQFCSGVLFPPACLNPNPLFCCEKQEVAPALPSLADTPSPPSLQVPLGFSPSVKSCSLDSFPACVCKLCGYPKKNTGQGKKRNKFETTGTKLYQQSWAHISFDDFSVCVLFLSLQLLGVFFSGETHPHEHTHTQKGYFYCSCSEGLVVKYCFWNDGQQNEQATVSLLVQ